ncbi:hypothetical protein EMCRGX_G024231 [Ephydatia muelleri]
MRPDYPWGLKLPYLKLLGPDSNRSVFARRRIRTKRSGDLERLLLSLPPRLGGLGFTIPTNLSAIEFDASMTVTKPLYDLILQKKTHYPLSVFEAQIQAKKQLHQSKQQQTQDTAANLLPQLSESSQRSMVLTQEKGASS